LLEQAVGNLLSNAVKYSGSPSIEVSLSRQNGAAVVEVKDFGIGIADEHKARIFERFYRGASARETAPGHGLGLSLARHVARVHGGDVVASASGGERTVFELRLPGWRGAEG